jgi:hypothetical protein
VSQNMVGPTFNCALSLASMPAEEPLCYEASTWPRPGAVEHVCHLAMTRRSVECHALLDSCHPSDSRSTDLGRYS